MDIKITKLPKSAVKLEIVEKAEKVKQYFDKSYEELSKNIDIKGFRPGGAPRLMTIEAIGAGRYNSYALDLALPQIYTEAVKTEKFIPVASPKVNIIDFAEDKDFKFEATVDVLPEIKLGDYKNIKIKHTAEKIEVKDEEVDKVVKRLLYQSAKYLVTNDPAKEGDRMEISFEGKVKGVMQEKYTSKHYPFILGEKVLLPEFEKEITGLKKGDNKKFKLEIKNPTGKDKVDFDVTVNEVWKVELPKLDDEFVKKFGHKTVKDLWDAIAKSIKMEKEQHERQIVEEKVFDELLKKMSVELPESMIEQETNHRIEHLQKQMGPGFEKYLESQKKTIADLQKDVRPAAERGVRVSLAISELAKNMGYFDAKKLGSDMQKNQEYQREAMKKSVDELIKIATK